MAFQIEKLSPQNGSAAKLEGVGGGVAADVRGFPTVWEYVTTADAQAAVVADGYFNRASNDLRVGDRIYATANAESASFTVAELVVRTISSAGVVTVAVMSS